MKKKYITFYIIVSIFVLFIGLTLCQFEQFNNPILLPSQNQNIENEGAEAASNSFSVTLTSYIRDRYGTTITGMNIELYVSSGYKGDYNWKYHVYYSSGSYGKSTGSLTRILGQKYRGLCIETSCDYTGRKTAWVGYKATDSSNSNVYAELLTSSAVSIMADTRSYFTGMTISSICSSGFKNDVDYNDDYASPNFYIYLYPNILYSFDMNGGSSSNGANTSIIYNTKDQKMQLYNGNTMSKLTVPNRTGYTFAGYYNAKSGGTQVIDADGKWTGNWNLYNIRIAPLYAQWEANSYNINYNLNNGTLGAGQPESASYGNRITISNPTRTGYHFTGWRISNYSSTAETGTGFILYTWSSYDGGLTTRIQFRNLQTTAGSTVTFTANWEINTYKVRFNANGGSGSMTDQSFTYNTAQNLKTNSFTQTGYTFKGWNTQSKGEGKDFDDNESVNNLTTEHNGVVNLYAQWEQNSLKATLNYQGKGTGSTTATAKYNTNGTKLNLPSSLTHTGYTFKGWSLTPNGTGEYNADTNWNNITINNTTVSTPNAGEISFDLYAIWQANKYTINLNLQGGSGVTSPINATYDKVINIPNPAKTGYTFTGWTASGLSDTAQAGGASWNGTATTATAFKNLTTTQNSTVTLYANWTAITYTIAFNSNGGSGNMQNQSFTYDSEKALSTNTFKRAGYIFKGWNTKFDGTGTSYLDKAKVRNLASKQGTKITLYAQWQSTIASDIKSTFETAGTYYISTAEDLAKLIYTTENKDVGNGYTFIQTANIDLSGLTYLPIGRLNSFSGTYDGQGNIISGITTYNGKDANKNYLETNGGLFANASGAKIKNVIIENATIYGQNAGIIAGSGNSSTAISGCIVSGNVNGTNKGSIIGNGKGAKISVCLAKGVNTASFASGSASIDSCIYELNNTNKTRGKSSIFNKYNEWIYPSNFAYPMPKAFMWYPYPELSESSLNSWMDR